MKTIDHPRFGLSVKNQHVLGFKTMLDRSEYRVVMKDIGYYKAADFKNLNRAQLASVMQNRDWLSRIDLTEVQHWLSVPKSST